MSRSALLLHCPNCGTRFLFDPARFTGGTFGFENCNRTCSKCGSSFPLPYIVTIDGKLDFWWDNAGNAIEVVIRELQATSNPIETAGRWISTLGSVSTPDEIEAISALPEFKWLPQCLPQTRKRWAEAVRAIALSLMLIVSWYLVGNTIEPLDRQAVACVVNEACALNQITVDVVKIAEAALATSDPRAYLEFVASKLHSVRTSSEVVAILPYLEAIPPDPQQFGSWVRETLSIVCAEGLIVGIVLLHKKITSFTGKQSGPDTKEITEIVLKVIEENEERKKK